jgi:hypothetical protein
MIESLEKYIPKRNKFLIKNNYELIKKSNDNFHCVIYYVDKNKIEIVIRNINDGSWNYDLKIKFDNQTILSVGSCYENVKVIELYTNFEVEQKINKELYFIPKLIIQTNKVMIKNIYHSNSLLSLLEKNPDYDYIFFDDIDARNFIKENFKENILPHTEKIENETSDVLKAYDLLKCGALRADFFRYCYLYVNGGIYIDSKVSCFLELDEIINSDDKFIIIKDDAENSLYNGIMIFEKASIIMFNMIKDLMNNIYLKNYFSDIHEPTGNKLYYKHFKSNHFKLNKKRNLIYYDNKLAFDCDYKDYYKKDYEDFRVNYFKKDYYYFYSIYINQYIFRFSNNLNNQIFLIFHLKDNIYVLKNNNNNSWNFEFNLNIYDINLNINKDIMIYKNNDSEFVFSV